MGAKNFDVKLKKFRRAVNELKGMLQLNQKEIGQKLGYSSESAFSQVMNGKVPVSDAVIYRIIEMGKGSYSYEWFNSEGESITQNNIMGDNNIGSDETMQSLILQNEKLIGELAGIDGAIKKVWFVGGERREKIFKKYELLTTHAGRRSFVVNAIFLGIAPEVIMKWTGHANYESMKPYIYRNSRQTKAAGNE